MKKRAASALWQTYFMQRQAHRHRENVRDGTDMVWRGRVLAQGLQLQIKSRADSQQTGEITSSPTCSG